MAILFSLYEIPFVSVEIAEHGDGAVRFFSRWFSNRDAMVGHVVVVVPEIACFQEERDSPAGLVADVIRLIVGDRFGEQNGGAAIILRSDDHPTLTSGKCGIFYELKP